ncbi:hypothetical protein Dda_7438 [Drechslerella dactyloides]|uniref:Uncharacterized protein n=1 Tax=Drechslerella dactyloides TaxID=74499 RepID=A0AAD6NFK6_DREDA|nr:hypothetical protein Dda_7438 [Drechslerella dactyloides]
MPTAWKQAGQYNPHEFFSARKEVAMKFWTVSKMGSSPTKMNAPEKKIHDGYPVFRAVSLAEI